MILHANPTKWPNTLKQFVGKLLFIDIYDIIIDLDTRDEIISVMNSERFSHFQPFTHYSTT